MIPTVSIVDYFIIRQILKQKKEKENTRDGKNKSRSLTHSLTYQVTSSHFELFLSFCCYMMWSM